jgi:ferredoxin-NADP reductase
MNESTLRLGQAMKTAGRLLGSPWLRPLNDLEAIDDLLAQVHPIWSLGRIKARVVEIREEAPDVRSFVLAPNRRWPGFAAGQHVIVALEIRGVRHHRTYSLSSAPSDRFLRLTVKRHAGGRVSNAIHDQLVVGNVLELSPPAGEFVLARALRRKLLMLSAGSGITPVASMLRDLQHRDPERDVVFFHVCRTPRDAVFAAELHVLPASMRALRLVTHVTAERGRVDADGIAALVPDHAERQTLLCGPASFMEMVQARWDAEGLTDRLVCERFSGPVARPRAAGVPVQVRATRSNHSFTSTGERPLLVEAERAGLAPKHGCRIGICRTCRCRMKSGTVENLRTGELSSEPGQLIQLCVSAARSDLEIDL